MKLDLAAGVGTVENQALRAPGMEIRPRVGGKFFIRNEAILTDCDRICLAHEGWLRRIFTDAGEALPRVHVV